MIKKLDEMINHLKMSKISILSVAAAHNEEVLLSIKEAVEMGIIKPILIGNIEKIRSISESINFNLDEVELIQEDDLTKCAQIAVKLVNDNKADFIMKGLLDTSILLKEVLNKEYGLKKDGLLSHVMIYELEKYHKLLLITDGGMNITPNYEQKEEIIKNAINAAKSLEIDEVKVACLAAVEKVNSKMQATIDGIRLQEACNEGKFGDNVIVEGPMAFDLAISKHSSEVKGFNGRVAGDADVILVPIIEVGNALGKSLTYMANSKSAGVVMGAKVPIVLTSRADSSQAKLYSIVYGALISKNI
ncbi:MAG: bifunctional enoyl-CoA hydratase/phosphate acetyltransferase [Peptostreptococcaceae bacterium]